MMKKTSKHWTSTVTVLERHDHEMTVKQIAAEAGISRRTAAQHLRDLVNDGFVRERREWPEHLYRLQRP